MPVDQVGVLLDEQHVVAGGVQVRGDGRPHAAGSGDGDLHRPPPHRATGAAVPPSRAENRSRAASDDHQVEDVAVLADQVGEVEPGHAGPGDRHQGDLARHGQVGQPLARPPLGEVALDQRERAGRIGPLGLHLVRAAGGGGPGRWSTTRWPPWGCPAAGRSGPAGGRRCGPPRWGSRRSRGRCGRSGCSSCRRWSPRPARTPRAARARSRSSRSKPEPTMVVPGQSAGSRRKALGLRSMMATVWPWADQPDAQSGTDPAATDDDDVHAAHATRIAV